MARYVWTIENGRMGWVLDPEDAAAAFGASATSSAPGDAAVAGSTGTVSDAGHVHGREPSAAITSARVGSEVPTITSGIQTIDGVEVAAGEKVLLMRQTDYAENGVWQVAAGAWTALKTFGGLDPLHASDHLYYVADGSYEGFWAPYANQVFFRLGEPHQVSAILASTSNIASLSGTSHTIDGIGLAPDNYGMFVLVRAQTTASQNGLYLIVAGAWTKYPLTSGATVRINAGPTYKGSYWSRDFDDDTVFYRHAFV